MSVGLGEEGELRRVVGLEVGLHPRLNLPPPPQLSSSGEEERKGKVAITHIPTPLLFLTLACNVQNIPCSSPTPAQCPPTSFPSSHTHTTGLVPAAASFLPTTVPPAPSLPFPLSRRPSRPSCPSRGPPEDAAQEKTMQQVSHSYGSTPSCSCAFPG